MNRYPGTPLICGLACLRLPWLRPLGVIRPGHGPWPISALLLAWPTLALAEEGNATATPPFPLLFLLCFVAVMAVRRQLAPRPHSLLRLPQQPWRQVPSPGQEHSQEAGMPLPAAPSSASARQGEAVHLAPVLPFGADATRAGRAGADRRRRACRVQFPAVLPPVPAGEDLDDAAVLAAIPLPPSPRFGEVPVPEAVPEAIATGRLGEPLSPAQEEIEVIEIDDASMGDHTRITQPIPMVRLRQLQEEASYA